MTVGYHGWTKFCNIWLELDRSECLGPRAIWESLGGELRLTLQ